MDLRAVREALRLLRLEKDLALEDLGVNRATVHRIENIRGNADYDPRLSSIGAIIEACGYTLGEFFTKVDQARTVTLPSGVGLLSELTDERTVKQVIEFLKLPEPTRQAIALVSGSTSAPTPARASAPIPAPTVEAHTKSRSIRHRSSGRKKTGT